MKNISKMSEDELLDYSHDIVDGNVKKYKSPGKGSEQKWKALIIWAKANLKVPDTEIWYEACALCVKCVDIDIAVDNENYIDCDYCPLNSYFKCYCNKTMLWYELKATDIPKDWIKLAEQFLQHIIKANKEYGKPRKELAK